MKSEKCNAGTSDKLEGKLMHVNTWSGHVFYCVILMRDQVMGLWHHATFNIYA